MSNKNTSDGIVMDSTAFETLESLNSCLTELENGSVDMQRRVAEAHRIITDVRRSVSDLETAITEARKIVVTLIAEAHVIEVH